MERKMASELILLLAPQPGALAIAVVADLAIGDPAYRLHPVRLIGDALVNIEKWLRAIRAEGYGGGCVLFVSLAAVSVAPVALVLQAVLAVSGSLAWIVHAFIVYSLLALGDLLRHVWRVEDALTRKDPGAARQAVAMLVGRDTDRMDPAACRRAAIESMSENLTDGFVSALFWYGLAGLPGLVIFKVVSTLDSMVGFRTARYLRFGWCGARLDDAMNYVPARLACGLIAAVAVAVPACSSRKAWTVALTQHAVVPSPNSGWSEAAMAGAIQRRLIGPLWNRGELVTDIWLGDPADPPAATSGDVVRAAAVTLASGLAAATLVEGMLLLRL
jgi:adenosylcobinamide-phosphate synthase